MSLAKGSLFSVALFFAFAFGCAGLNHLTYLTEVRLFLGLICVSCGAMAGWLAYAVAEE